MSTCGAITIISSRYSNNFFQCNSWRTLKDRHAEVRPKGNTFHFQSPDRQFGSGEGPLLPAPREKIAGGVWSFQDCTVVFAGLSF